MTFVLFLYYVYMNRRRGGGDVDVEERYLERGVWERMTDRENKRFRYVY